MNGRKDRWIDGQIDGREYRRIYGQMDGREYRRIDGQIDGREYRRKDGQMYEKADGQMDGREDGLMNRLKEDRKYSTWVTFSEVSGKFEMYRELKLGTLPQANISLSINVQ